MSNLKKQIRLALLAAAAVLAAAFGSWFLASSEQLSAPVETAPTVKLVPTQPVTADATAEKPQPTPVNAPADPAAQAALEERLGEAPEFSGFFARLRALYPGDYDAAVKLATGQGVEKADNAADLFLEESVRLLRQTRGLNGAKAGGQALDRLFDTHLSVLRQLAASDAALCVDFLNGAPADRFGAFTGAHRALMADEALAGLEAIEDGAQKKIDREAPSPQDFDDLEKLLRSRGLDAAAIALLLDGKEPTPPLSDEQVCHNGLIYLDALKTLPDLQRLRLYALALEVMAHE